MVHRLLLLLAAIPTATVAQYYSPSQTRQYNPYPGHQTTPGVPYRQQNMMPNNNSGQSVIYEHGKQQVCNTYGGVTTCN